MKVDKNTLSRIAHLARLDLTEGKEEAMVNSMNDIIGWVEKLSELDTEDVEPLTHMSEEINAYRADEVSNTLDHEDGLKNAPKRDSNYFRVPKVLD